MTLEEINELLEEETDKLESLKALADEAYTNATLADEQVFAQEIVVDALLDKKYELERNS